MQDVRQLILAYICHKQSEAACNDILNSAADNADAKAMALHYQNYLDKAKKKLIALIKKHISNIEGLELEPNLQEILKELQTDGVQG